jgi:hypothetical protein
MSASKANYPFREAVLTDYKGDLSKTWWVNYYVWSELKGELIRKRTRFSQATKKERYEQAKEFISIINDALKEGGFVDEIVVQDIGVSKKSSVKSAMEFFLNAKKKVVSQNTIEGYIKDLKVFEEWTEKTGYLTKAVSTIGTQEVFAFSDFLDSYRREGNDKVGYSKKSYSNFISTLRTMWTFYMSREILTVNPFLKVNKRKGASGQYVPYSSEQVRDYKKVCLQKLGDEQLWLFVNFVYYGFFRPAEEGQMLQVDIPEHVDPLKAGMFWNVKVA